MYVCEHSIILLYMHFVSYTAVEFYAFNKEILKVIQVCNNNCVEENG